MNKKQWYDYIPHPVVMLFGMLVMATLLSYIIPAGSFDRAEIDGRMSVVPGSYKAIAQTPLSLMDMFMALPLGFKTAVDIIFIVMASGIMFGFMEKSGAIENAIGTLVKKMGIERKYLIVFIMTFVFGSLGVFVGYENNIAMIPIACLLSLALGGDLMLAAGMSVGAITVGFGLSPVNPYTIGTGQKIAQLPLFSGWELRTALCMTAMSIMAFFNIRYFKKITSRPEESLASGIDSHGFALSKPLEQYSMSKKDLSIFLTFVIGIVVILYGVFVHHWFINQISAIFCIITLIIGIIDRNSDADFGNTVLRSVGHVAPGAFMVGLATSIKVALEMGNISDTISHHLAQSLTHLPLTLSAGGMVFAQIAMNLVIPSGSGQALATLPV
ncbi:MAG: YfcC family protein, partial [Saprospiraceae bacterium]